MASMQILSLAIVVTVTTCSAKPVGFSYAKFSGPVSGPEREVFVQDEHGGGNGHVDYVARPDYQFAYGVEDPKSKVLQNRKESRNGDSVKGEYSVVDPDGTLRVVRYTADKNNGFQAEVITDGKSLSYGVESPTQTQQVHHEHEYQPAPVYQQQQQPPAQHETYGTHEDVREEEEDEEDDDEEDDEDGSY